MTYFTFYPEKGGTENTGPSNMTDRNRRDTFVGRFPPFILLYAWVKFSRILDPAPLFGDPAPKL